MYPSQNEAVDGDDQDFDDFEIDQSFWLDFMDQYRRHGTREIDTPYGHAIASDYYDYETPTGDQRYPEFHAVSHDEYSIDAKHLREDKDHDRAMIDPHSRQFGYLVHESPHFEPVIDHEMREHLEEAHREREAIVGHYEVGYHHDEELPHHELDHGYAVQHLEVPMMHHEVEDLHYPVEHHEVYHHDPYYYQHFETPHHTMHYFEDEQEIQRQRHAYERMLE